MAFDIMALQKGRGPVQARSKADEDCAVLKYIDVDDLIPSEDNFYSMSAIDELATLIELSGGVKQPALVAPMGGGKYKVIAGHRRRLASLRLVQQGKEVYRKMPCMVDAGRQEPGADTDELRAIDEAILLITTNSQREKTDWDKVQEVTRLRELLDQKRRFEKIPGETRRIIAEQLRTTPAQVGRYGSIAKHLIPTFKGQLQLGQIGISVAYELSTLPEDMQNEIMRANWPKHGTVALEDVRRWKQEAEREPPPDEAEVAPKPERDRRGPATDGPKYKPGAYMQEETTKSQIVPPPPSELPAGGSTGKIVELPTTPAPPTGQNAPEQKKETMSRQRAAVLLEDLQMYCEEMKALEPLWVATWLQRVDALDMAIAALRK